MQNQSSLIWITILLLVFIVVLLSLFMYFDAKPYLDVIATASKATESASPQTTQAPVTTDAPSTTQPPTTTEPPSTTTPPTTTTPPSTTTPPTTTTPTPSPDAPTICIDPGHGFGDPGAIGKLNGVSYHEDTINLAIAQKLGDELAKLGYNVIYTHNGVDLPDDKYLSTSSPIFNVNNRLQMIKDQKSEIDLVISVHCNSFPSNTSVNGSRYYILKQGLTGYTAYSSYLANKITDALKASSVLTKDPVIYSEDLAVLKSGLPSVLLETLFLSNPSDLANLISPTWQSNYAKVIAQGIDSYCKQYIK